MPKNSVPKSVINRLPRYYRFLASLRTRGIVRISSRELAEKMGFTASQIRQDLNCFGGFGQQGYGYNVEQLYGEIGAILGLDERKKVILIGAGNLGRAIVTHMPFEQRGFSLVGIFDSKESIAGQVIRGLPVRNISVLDEFCSENRPTAAILCIPPDAAPAIVDQLVRYGIKGFWNFSHYDINRKYPDIPVESVHLNDSLMAFSYRLTEELNYIRLENFMADKFLEYKGKPLVRSNDVVYYGDMNDEYVIRFTVLDSVGAGDIKLSKRIKIDLVKSTDHQTAVKSSEKNGFYEAMDLGYVWLNRHIKK